MNKYIIFIIIFLIIKLCNKKKETFYGNNYIENKNTDLFDELLKKWAEIAKKEKIDYSISYGTYLGYVRNKKYIPYDGDMDIHICKTSVDKLLSLTKYKWCTYNKFLKNNEFKENDIKLVLNFDHNKLLNKRSRYNCKGELVKSQEDNCSFNGLIGRLIIKRKNRMKHLDLFVYHIEENKDKHKELEKNNLVSDFYGPYGSYIVSNIGSKLPPTKKCYLNNIETRCFNDNYGKDFLEIFYSKNYIKPNKKWDNIKKIWVKI